MRSNDCKNSLRRRATVGHFGHRSSSDQGFTLVELIIVTLMSSFILMAGLEFTTYQQYKSAEMTNRIARQTDIMVALQKIGRDIFHAGFGASDIPDKTLGTVPEIIANSIALATIDAGVVGADPFLASIGTVAVLVPGSDELIVSGTYFTPFPVSRIRSEVYDATNTDLHISTDGGRRFQVGDNVVFFAPNRAAWPVFPAQQIYPVQAVLNDPTNANAYTIRVNPPLPAVADAGTEVYGIVPNGSGQKLYKVQYGLVNDIAEPVGEPKRGTLRRIRFLNGASVYSAANWENVPVLSNVIDFQVQFLVFPCNAGANNPVWMDDPDATEFDQAVRYPNIISRSVHRRSRILAVRVSVLVEAERRTQGASDNIHLAPGLTSMRVQNNLINGFNAEKEYILRESVFDPINYILRDGNWAVRDAVSNQNSFSPSTGDCTLIGSGS